MYKRQVKPVAKRITHDGVSPILVKEGSWEEQYEELWSFLIPSSGAAKTVQGEVIRIPGRVPVSYTHLDVYKRQIYNLKAVL